MVKRIGIGDELVMYLHFLVAAGEYDERLRMMGAEVREMFRGESAVKAPEWLLTLSDKRLAEKLAWEVGTAFDGGDFASYFEVAGAKLGHNPQAWLLYGYCVRMAESDLEMALETYQGLGYPKRIDNTGMGAVMAAMPEGSDFARYANWMGEDSKTLAQRARRALLANWAGRDPVAAADFVQSADPVKVFPRQIGTVLNVWLAADEEAALAWVEKSTGAARAEGGGLMSHAPLMAKATPSIVSVFPAMILNEGDPDAALDRFHLPPEARGDGGNDGRPAERATGSGSGVIIPKDGYIVTNRHVMILPNGKAADSIRIELADKRQVSAELVGMDAMTDLA